MPEMSERNKRMEDSLKALQLALDDKQNLLFNHFINYSPNVFDKIEGEGLEKHIDNLQKIITEKLNFNLFTNAEEMFLHNIKKGNFGFAAEILASVGVAGGLTEWFSKTIYIDHTKPIPFMVYSYVHEIAHAMDPKTRGMKGSKVNGLTNPAAVAPLEVVAYGVGLCVMGELGATNMLVDSALSMHLYGITSAMIEERKQTIFEISNQILTWLESPTEKKNFLNKLIDFFTTH